MKAAARIEAVIERDAERVPAAAKLLQGQTHAAGAVVGLKGHFEVLREVAAGAMRRAI